MFSTYEIVYLMGSIMNMYTVYIFTQVFFSNKDRDLKIDIIIYTIYYLIGNTVYLFIDIPVFNMFVNLFFIALIAGSHRGTVKNKVFMILSVIFISSVVETVVVSFTDFIRFANPLLVESNINSIPTKVINDILFFTIVLAIRKSINKREDVDTHFLHWLAIVFVPFGTICLYIVILQGNQITNIQIILVSAICLVLNFMVLKLYDILKWYYVQIEQERAMKLIEKSASTQLDLIEASTNNLLAIRHDTNKHFTVLKDLAKDKQYSKIITYIEEINDTRENIKIVFSGNYVIDSLLNFEISYLENHGIKVQHDIGTVPDKVEISRTELAALIGNILSNAREALDKEDNSSLLKVKLKYDRGMLFIEVVNSFTNDLKQTGELEFTTTKNDKFNHGYGLNIIKSIVRKYDGTIQISTNKFFSVRVMIYC